MADSCSLITNLYNLSHSCDFMGLEFFALKVLEWLIGETLGKKILSKAKEKIAGDEFRILGDRALHETIRNNLEYTRILNTLRENGVFEVDDATELDTEKICGTLSDEDKDVCCDFLETLKKRYFEIVFELGNKNPLTKLILEKIQLMLEEIQENRERIARIEKYVSKEIMSDLKKIAELQKEINSQVKRIDDFVGRDSLIHNFDPARPLLIEGEVGIGKSYLLMRMASLYDGQYIPLKIVKDLKIFDALVTDAKNNGRRLFIDDLDHASEEIKNYILTNVWVAVMASRPPVKFEREIARIKLPGLEKEDIGRYLETKSIEIEGELLEKLEKDLSLPIKLRVFVNFLRSRNISSLNSQSLLEILKDIGIDGLVLPKDLEDWYDNFVWRDFEEKKYPRGAKRALFVLSLARISVNIDIISRILEVDEETASDIIESLKAFINYHEGYFHIFHESISKFIKNKVGGLTSLNLKMGDVFSSLTNLVYRWEALYHYREGESRDKFEKIFCLEDMNRQIFYCLWNEALENMIFSENNGIEIDNPEFFLIYGALFRKLGKWDDALRKFEKSLEKFRDTENRSGVAQVYDSIGLTLADRGEWNRAEQYYAMSLEIKEQIGDKYGIAQTYGNMSSIFARKGEWKKAEEYYERSLRIIGETGDKHLMAQIYVNMGTLLMQAGEWTKAEKYYKRSLEVFEENGDKHGMSQIYGNMGVLFVHKGEWKKAEEYYNKDLEISEKIEDRLGIARTYMNVGSLFLRKRELKKAEGYYNRSLRISEEIDDKHGITQTYMSIGNLFMQTGEWKKAEEYYSKSLKMKKEIGDKHGMAQVFGNMGLLSMQRREWNKAEEYYNKNLKIFEEIGDKHGMAQVFGNMGLLFVDRGEWKKAEEYYSKSLKMKKEIGDKHGMAETYMNLGTLFSRKKEFEKTKKCYNKSLKIFAKVGDKDGIAQTYMNMGLLSVNIGKLKKAEEYYNRSLKISAGVGDKCSMARTYGNMGVLFGKKGEFERAEEHINKEIELLEDIGDIYSLAQTYVNMSNLRLLQSNEKEALRLLIKSRDLFTKLGAKNDIWITLKNEFNFLLRMGEFETSVDKLLAIFKNSYREDLVEESLLILRDFVIRMEEISHWDIISQIDKLSPFIENSQIKLLLQSIAAYGKTRLKEISLQEFEDIRSQITDENLSEIMDWIIINDPT